MEKMSESGLKVMRFAALIMSAIIALLFIGAIVLGYFLAWDRFVIALIIILAIVLLLQLIIDVWLKPIYKYRTFGYTYDSHIVTVRKGFIMIKQTRIPTFRIQNVDFKEGWLMRKYQLATLTLSTAGGNVDVTLIDKAIAQKVMAFIKNKDAKVPISEAKPIVEQDEKEEGPL
ncbi:PH domain-containing protein [Staphylococcus pseudintermedius]|uniref:PH domain-containing protein n=1 Tax=Staphylococcus pseudintermedius TaxID=283734 RepID=UPI0018F64372|nr:PH domain-containing protein [Staphylococcus pseudintermedius]MBJ8244548.1 PH domain-containing protein [Staphylococcus pseudintermedius]MBJ8256027.1 PH domain-containing protein [Staphylococcus pseudintermedius]UAS72847.1 PH domain-containing protein [Staphylococcus pseudintermedius]HAR6177865.1 PH domain-containing protein [Staphylococcus pseudintermedius]HCU5979430.1 PH domain-containing protein [Staphylococcus pseudintermedius]